MTTGVLLQEVIDRCGTEHQLFQAAEELAELTQAVSKYNRNPGPETRANLIEEMADVSIMLRQIRIIADISPVELAEVMDQKLKRLEERLRVREQNPGGYSQGSF